MQQYRFNYRMFIGLVVGALLCSAAIYGLWQFQIGRKSEWLNLEAEKARKAGDHQEAARYYSQYLTIHPRDDQARINYANEQAEIAKSDDVSMEDLGLAVKVLETTVRSTTIADKPEVRKLRRQLVELYGSENVKRYPDALEHLSYLIESDPEDADLQALKATYLARSGNFDDAVQLSYTLIGYDPKKDEFDVKKAKTPHHVELYTNLAVTLRSKKNDPDLADRVMDQLVDVNPKSAEAHLARGRYELSVGNVDEAESETDEAYKLKPKDANVLNFSAEMASRNEDYEKAAEFIAAGKKLHPNDVRFYTLAAGVQMKMQKYKEAIEEINQGIKVVKGANLINLLAFKVELQFGQKDLAGVRESVKELDVAASKYRRDLIEYYEARIMIEEGKWYQAKEALSKLRSKMADFGPARVMELNYYLGWCYEKLGQPDMAAEAYQAVLAQDPSNEPSAAALARVNLQKGIEAPDTEDDPLTIAYNIEMSKPKAERDWPTITRLMDEIAKEKKWDELTIKIQHARLATVREDFATARKLLGEAKKVAPDNILVNRLQIQIVRLDPKLGPAKALELYEKVVKEVGDQPQLRLDKADILIALHADKPKDELKAQLAQLFTGIDQWNDAQKSELWGGMAGRYLNLGLIDEARQYLTLAADARPNELPLRLQLFALSLDANDDAGMKDAQAKIVQIVGSQNDSAWLYTEARRRLSLVRRKQLEPEAIGEIRRLVDQAVEQRPDWHDLYVLNGELELAAGNLPKALEHFNKAQELGRPSPAATAQHIKLLAMAGRVKQAGQLLERIPETLRYPLLGQLYPEILFNTNRVEEALAQAQAAIKASPTSAQAHYWYSQLLARTTQDPKVTDAQRKETMDKAIKEMRQAVELQPEFPEAWFSLISYYSQLKDEEQAQGALREAQLMLSGDNLQGFLARSYESLLRWFDAETMYRAVYESAPDEIPRAQQLAAFYMGNVYQRPDKIVKVTPLINKILRAGVEKKIQPNDANLLWARRTGARILAETQDYQNLLKAEKLLASSSSNGELSVEDKLMMAEILAGRPEPASRKRAIALLEGVNEIQGLNEKAEVALGELYFAAGEDWRKYSAQMERAIARFPESLSARASYVKQLLDRGDARSLEKATTHVQKMRQLAPKHVASFEYTVRLADKLGKQEAARAELLRAVPDMSKVQELSEQQSQMLIMLAQLLVELDDLDSAERIYRDVAAKNPNKIPALANFLGTHRSVEQCFQKLNEVYAAERIPALLQVGLVVVRKQREKIGDKFDPQLQQWLDAGLRENPDSINLLIDQADLYDVQKRYDDAAKVYRDLLKRDDLTGIRRAIVLNNLAFLAALSGSAAEDIDALKLVDEASEIMGPNSDILDTRAVVHIARKDYQNAIEDLVLAVTDKPTASKYFHKAQAHLLANENRAAVEAWEKAEALGLDHDAINLMEIQLYDQLKGKIDQIRGSSVTKAEGLRRAG